MVGVDGLADGACCASADGEARIDTNAARAEAAKMGRKLWNAGLVLVSITFVVVTLAGVKDTLLDVAQVWPIWMARLLLEEGDELTYFTGTIVAVEW